MSRRAVKGPGGSPGPRPSKPCARCGRRIEWRKKWERDWGNVRYCGDACRASRPGTEDAALEDAIAELLRERPAGASICPSEAARRVRPDDWRAILPATRFAANRLAALGRIEVTQGGRPVDPSTAKGPVRLRLPARRR